MTIDAMQRALRDALRRGDSPGYVALIAETPLLLAVEAAGGQPRPVAITLPSGERATPQPTTSKKSWPKRTPMATTSWKLVPAFTCLENVHQSIGARPVCAVTLADLADRWPDPAWMLAIDPGLPTATHLAAEDLRELVDDAFAPANDTERAILEAKRTGDEAALAVAVLRADIHLPLRPGGGASRDLTDPSFPWWPGQLWGPAPHDGIAVAAFTSERRLMARLGIEHRDAEWVVVSMPALAASWPDPAWTLAVDPGTPMAITLGGADLAQLSRSLDQVRTDPLRFLDPEPDWWLEPPQEQFELQVAIVPAAVGHYLDGGYDRAAGVVHLRPPPDRVLTPAALHLRLGLDRPDSPFALSDSSVHILRWRPVGAPESEWRADPTARVAAAILPSGATLHRLHRDGTEQLLATFDAAARRWG